jgi:hypothetical protein
LSGSPKCGSLAMPTSQGEEIKARHHVGLSAYVGRYDTCDECRGPWPCDAAILISEIERAEKVIEAAQMGRGDGGCAS